MEHESIYKSAEKVLLKLLDRTGASEIVLTTDEGLPCCNVHNHQEIMDVEGTAALLIDTIKSISSLLALQSPEEENNDTFKHMNIRTEQGSLLIARSESFTIALRFLGKKARYAGLAVQPSKRSLEKIEDIFANFFSKSSYA
jgi:hypothetical protein